jgi:adenylate cyclase
VKQVGRELGVRYVLEGSVRKAGGWVRITAQLIEATSGAHLWADRFDGLLEDVFDLQDKVAISVAGVIEPTLQAAEILRSSKRPTNDLTAYDLYLRALRHHQSEDREGIFQALNMVRQAIARDPRYGIALSLAALCHGRLYVTGWDDPDNRPARGSRSGSAGTSRCWAGSECSRQGRLRVWQFGRGHRCRYRVDRPCRRAEPSFDIGWSNSAWLRLWAGQPDLALDYFATSVRLSPRENAPGVLLGIGIGHFFARRFEEARATLLRSMHESPGWVPNYRFLASCCAQMGRLDEAREIVQRLRALTPLVVPSATHWRNPEQRELYLAGLRLAMGEAE